MGDYLDHPTVEMVHWEESQLASCWSAALWHLVAGPCLLRVLIHVHNEELVVVDFDDVA